MAAWLKTFREGNPLSPINDPTDLPAIGEERVFSEPLSINADGTPSSPSTASRSASRAGCQAT